MTRPVTKELFPRASEVMRTLRLLYNPREEEGGALKRQIEFLASSAGRSLASFKFDLEK